MTSNQIKYQQNQETKRNNLAVETETNRSNLARETETHRSNVANETLTAARDAETARSNLARELETNRHNVATETETHRSNTANEELKKYDTDQKVQASNYSADKSYQGRIDSAYINQWGIAPTTVQQVGSAVKSVLTSPEAKKIGTTAATAGIVAAGKVASGLASTITQLKKTTRPAGGKN